VFLVYPPHRKLEKHPLSTLHDYLFNTYRGTIPADHLIHRHAVAIRNLLVWAIYFTFWGKKRITRAKVAGDIANVISELWGARGGAVD
jgi:hypothetical protein